MLLVAFVVGVAWAIKRGAKVGMNANQVLDASFWTIIAGVLGARLVFIAQNIPHYSQNLNELFSFQFQGLTSFGGIIFGVLAMMAWSWRAKVPIQRTFDLFAGPVLLGFFFGRIGCLLNGCCWGCPTGGTVPWGISVAGEPGPHHPAQVYDALMNLVGVGILLLLERKGLRMGQSAALFLILNGLSRFIYEFWRAGYSSSYLGGLPITEAQLVALVMVVGGSVWFAMSGLRSPPQFQSASPGL
jgi:phosphatidylglycerol:prolipoprotein diacylglycerol transferase